MNKKLDLYSKKVVTYN